MYVLLVDAGGQVRLSLSGGTGPVDALTQRDMADAFRARQPLLTDLRGGPGNPALHIGVIAPVVMADGKAPKPVGAVLLESAARTFLYPLIESWPTPSHSAETLLVRRDGDAVLFLNEVRHRRGTALKLRIPLSRVDVPAVAAVLGKEGVLDGKDYRGVAVLSAVMPIPDSPWFVVAKIDKAEALEAWRSRSILILALLLVMIAAAVAALLVVWQRNAKAHYRTLHREEVARRRSEERHRTTLISVGDGVITTDAEGRVELLNPVAATLTGWEQSEAQGRPVAEVFHILNEQTREPVENPVARVLSEGVVAGLANHTILIARDGRERPIADSGAPIRDEAGAITGIVLVFRDQTAERAHQKAILRQKKEFETIFNHAPGQIWYKDTHNRILRVNPQACRDLGMSAESIEGRSAEELFPLFAREYYEDDFTVIQTGQPKLGKIERVNTASGEIRWVLTDKIPVIGEDGNVTGLLVIVRDITEIRALEQERSLLCWMVENSLNEHYVLDSTTLRFLYANPKALANLGYTMEELAKFTPLDIDPLMVPQSVEDLLNSLRSGQIAQHAFESAHKRRDGSHYPVEVRLQLSPLDGESFFLSTVLDISERKRAEEEREELHSQLLQAQKMESIGRLAGGVAHDFNNLLTVINGYSRMALDQMPLPDAVRPLIEEVRAAGEQAAVLVQQLLAYSRQQVLQQEILDLNQVIRGMKEMLARLLGEDVELAVRLDPALYRVWVDRRQMEHVIMNLAVNSREAMPLGGRLTIESVNAGTEGLCDPLFKEVGPSPYIRLTLRDTGAGMDENTRQHLFEPFFTTKGERQATGLGLSMVHGIVTQSGGQIAVESQPGAGAVFHIYLPAVEREPGKAGSRESARTERGSETVLLVEDQPAVLRFATAVLESHGYRVLQAESGEQALARCAEERIDLLLTDVVMPQMSGFDLAVRARAIQPAMKALFISGYSEEIQKRHSEEWAAAVLLQKPFGPAALAAKVRQVLDLS